MPALDGKKFYTPMNDPELHRACRKLGMGLTENFLEGDTYIVENVVAPPLELLWPLMLGGKFICDRNYILSQGKGGAGLMHNAATTTVRSMHITPLFASQHADLASDLLWHSSARRNSGSKWTYIEGREAFLGAVQRFTAQKKPTLAIVFYTPAEEATFADVKMRFTSATGFDGLASIDRAHSASALHGPGERWMGRST